MLLSDMNFHNQFFSKSSFLACITLGGAVQARNDAVREERNLWRKARYFMIAF